MKTVGSEVLVQAMFLNLISELHVRRSKKYGKK
jgi:hypothetical protein